MAKILEVIKPFDVMEVGDTFELSENEDIYTSEFTEENAESSDAGSQFSSKYSSVYSISKSFAQNLIENGFLREVNINNDKPFVNVFSEIDELLDEYTEELDNIDETCANVPACLKVERETVLRNICTVLNHLKSLKK